MRPYGTDVIAVGRCSLCGGRVVVPRILMSVVPARPICEDYGAVRSDHDDHLPVLPMRPDHRPAPQTPTTPVIPTIWEYRKKDYAEKLRVAEAIVTDYAKGLERLQLDYWISNKNATTHNTIEDAAAELPRDLVGY